jgi:hypothetical protein
MKWIKWFLNFWEWPYNTYGDFREWRIMAKATKEPDVLKLLAENNMRVDRLSRIYTVVTVDEELSLNPNTQWPVLMEKMQPMNAVMAKIGLSGIVYPRIDRIDETNFLIILAPEYDYMAWKATLYELLKYFGYYIILGTVNNILLSTLGIDYLGAVGNLFTNIFDYLPF